MYFLNNHNMTAVTYVVMLHTHIFRCRQSSWHEMGLRRQLAFISRSKPDHLSS